MQWYTDEELENMLGDIESEFKEYKESFRGDAPDKARQAVCAFANDLPGHGKSGVLFVGIRDDGTASGLSISDELLRQLADIKTDGKILPLPVLTVQKRFLRGADVAVVIVAPSDMPPVRYDGRIWVRTGTRRSIASEQEERILIERRRYRQMPFDLRPVFHAKISDISRTLFEQEYLPNAFASDILEANGRTCEERLASCRMINDPEEGIPTVTGLLTLAPRVRDFIPGAYIQFLRIGGLQLGDEVSDDALIDGPLSQMIRQLEEKLKSHNRMSVNIRGNSASEERRQDYPIPALMQLAHNAILHRNYESTNSPVKIYWFDDRIEMHSPGGPYGNVNRYNFGEPGITDYRNPNLAEAMRVYGFVQKFGFGIATARDVLRKNGNPELEFEVESNSIMACIRKKIIR